MKKVLVTVEQQKMIDFLCTRMPGQEHVPYLRNYPITTDVVEGEDVWDMRDIPVDRVFMMNKMIERLGGVKR